jgi:gluconolactonase
MKATYSLDVVEIFGRGVLRAECVVIDRDNYAYGGGRGARPVMYKVSPDGKVNELAILPTGSMPAGVTMDRHGNLIYCDMGKQAVMRLTPSGQLSVIADRVGTLALTIPNFASYDAEGNLYVSNSSTRDRSHLLEELAKPEPKGALVRIRPDGRGDIVATGLYLANGTAIDPKEEAVYVLESTRYDCLRIAIKKDGTFGQPEIYAKGFPALPDGMAFDDQGNLYVTLPGKVKDGGFIPFNQIIKLDTNGNWTVLINDPDGQKFNFTTNCAFGGHGLQDLYIANLEDDHFSRVRTTFHGHPLYHQH